MLYINVREYRKGNQKGHYKETGNKVYRRRRKTKEKNTSICVGHHYTQTHTNNVNKTCTLLQTTGCKDEPNIVFICENRNGNHNTKLTTSIHLIGQYKKLKR